MSVEFQKSLLTFTILSNNQLLLLSPGHSSSLLCGKTNTTELGSNAGAGAALALTLVQSAGAGRACHLRVNAPEAAALAVRLIDVKVCGKLFYILDAKKKSLT